VADERERRTTSGIPLQRIYGPGDLEGFSYEDQLGDAGAYPFTRGIHPEMYRRRQWTIRQYAGYGTAEDTNRRFRFLVDNGQLGLSLAFDLPTQLGLDSDHPETMGEVGRLGVAIDALEDMRRLYAGIPLDRVSTSMTINATAPVILAMYVAVGEEQGVPRSALRGTVQNDVFKEYLARGLFVFPPAQSLRLMVDVVEFCVRELPSFNAISVSAPHIRSAGALYVQALAYMFLAAELVVEEAVRRGVDVNDVGASISFLAGADNDFFETICRHRASRRIWARLMKEGHGATEDRALVYRLAGSGNPLNLTDRQPLNNLARITLQGLANVLGGCQSLVLPCWDEAFSIPTEDAVRLSLNIQRILAHETGLTDVVDPLGGSYFVEALTDEIERRVVAEMDEVRGRGGLIASIEDGSLHGDMAQRAFEQEQAIQAGERVVVGVNRFEVEEDRAAIESSMHTVDPAVEALQRERVARYRAERDQAAASAAMVRVDRALASGENVMEPLIGAVRAGATLGELVTLMSTRLGTYRTPMPL